MSLLRARVIIGVGSFLIAGGSLLAGYAVGHGIPSRSAPTVVAAAYNEPGGCSGCPAEIRLDSVEVQSRQDTTLFVIRGRWPASVDALSGSVRLVANDVAVVLKPHGSQNAFEVVTATRGGSDLPTNGVSAGLQQGAVLIGVSSSALAAPVVFEVGLWDGHAYTGRLPRSGQLIWAGSGPPRLQTATITPATSSSATTSTASTARPTIPAIDLTLFSGACSAIPSGTLPAALQITQVAGFTPQPDPRTGVPARKVTATLGGNPLGLTVPYSIVAVILHAGDSPPGSQSRPIDRAGEVQLTVLFDGNVKHKGIRTFAGTAWTQQLDSGASALTYDISQHGAGFYWTGLQPGDRFGFITASGGSCGVGGLDSQLRPLQAVP